MTRIAVENRSCDDYERNLPDVTRTAIKVSPPQNPHCPIDERYELSTVSKATFIRYIDHVNIKISNSPAQKGARHQVTLPDTLPPPSFPSPTTCPGSPTLIYFCSEESLTAANHAPLLTGEELTNRRASFAQHLAMTAD